jgi:hypothetical protein
VLGEGSNNPEAKSKPKNNQTPDVFVLFLAFIVMSSPRCLFQDRVGW